MRRWIRYNIDIVLAMLIMLMLFLDFCMDVAGHRILSPIFGALATLCIISYCLYYHEIDKRKRQMRLAREREERRIRREMQMLEDYADYKRARLEREEACRLRKER